MARLFLYTFFSFTLPHIMLIPLIIITLLTLLGKDKEDYKWFVFHTTMLNLILGIFRELTYFTDGIRIFGVDLYGCIDYAINLAVNSIFPLAFTRFLFLYFPYFYSKFFTKKTIILWILGYDGLIFGLGYLNSIHEEENLFIVNIVITCFLLLCTIFCSCLIFLKIRKMKKLVANYQNFSSHRDLKRAAFICVFQASIISLNLLNSIFCQIFINNLANDVYLFNIFFGVYMFLNSLQYAIYYFFVIIDSFVTLIVLRTYRRCFIMLIRKIVKSLNITSKEKIFIHVQPQIVRVASRISQLSKK